MRRPAVSASGALMVLLLAPALPAGSQQQGDGFSIRLVDAPVERADDPRAHQYIVDHVAPGSTIERRVEVRNDSGSRLGVDLYAGAARIEDDELRFGERATENELTGWTTVDPSELVLEPTGEAQALVTIAVPSDARQGEHYGVVWAEAQAAQAPGEVATVHRVGIRIYLSVGTGSESPTAFDIVSLTAARDDGGAPLVRAAVDNVGGRAVDLSGELELSDGPAGLSAGPFSAGLGTTLAPGTSGTVEVSLDPELPDGPWHAVLTLRSGTTEAVGEAEILFPDVGAAPAVRVESAGSDDLGWVRIALAVLIAALVALAVFVLLRRRRRA